MKTDRVRDSEDHLTEAALDASPAKLFPSGAVLVVTRSGILAHTLPVAVAEVPVTVNQDLKVLVPSPGLDSYYLAHGIRAHAQQVLELCSKDGTTVDSIDSAKLLRFELPIAPAPEQTRITQALESYFTRLDDAVATLERVQRNLKRYRASVLKAAVEGRLVPTEAELARAEKRDYEPASALLKRILVERRHRWEEAELAKMKAAGKTPKDDKWKSKYKEPAAPDTTDLPCPPEGWCWASGDQLTSRITKGSSPNWQGFEYTEQGILFVRSQNVGWGNLDLQDRAYLSPAFNAQEVRSVLEVGDVLLNIVGASIGRAALVTSEVAGGNTNQAVAIIRLVPGGLEPGIATVYLISPTTQQMIHREKVDVARANLSLGDVAILPFPVAPSSEQRRILERVDDFLSVVDRIDADVRCVAERARRLRQSILKWAFAGKLVNQDPTDEPAGELLSRIRAERPPSTTNAPVRRVRRSMVK
jgi:type I restriction enzyme S subunit